MIWPTCMLPCADLHAAEPERGHDAQVEQQHHQGHVTATVRTALMVVVHPVVVGLAKALYLVAARTKALTTRTPARFSCITVLSASSLRWTSLNIADRPC